MSDTNSKADSSAMLTPAAKLAIRDYLRTWLAVPALIATALLAVSGFLIDERLKILVAKSEIDAESSAINRAEARINRLVDDVIQAGRQVSSLEDENRRAIERAKSALQEAGRLNEETKRRLGSPNDEIVPLVFQRLTSSESGFPSQVADVVLNIVAPPDRWPASGRPAEVRVDSTRNGIARGDCPAGKYLSGLSIVDGDTGGACRGCISGVVLICRSLR